ncbi:hypothetical protein BSL78_03189 [Apostichopus japonicus]|uniref:Fibrinogen C-terminal domain-containing protein n=1 Tax=Stichopus japonicus TaxID=307972 RepID=A0A2G8LI13_STIJA|nr:hypothetical protein BSL78_03189 [Apostichopus japonicus]
MFYFISVLNTQEIVTKCCIVVHQQVPVVFISLNQTVMPNLSKSTVITPQMMVDGRSYNVGLTERLILTAWEDYQLGFGFLSSELWIVFVDNYIEWCPTNKTYNECQLCEATCADPDSCINTSCKGSHSCVCPDGFLMNGDNCIRIEDCGCFMENETDGERGVLLKIPKVTYDACNDFLLSRKEEFTSLQTVTRNVLVRIIIFPVTIVINAILMQIVKKETVFQRRVDALQDFYLYWDDYKIGFGNQSRNFWLGNEKIHSLTNQRQYELRIDFVDKDGDPYYAKYDFFRISDENDNFRLDVGNYSDGDAGRLISPD